MMLSSLPSRKRRKAWRVLDAPAWMSTVLVFLVSCQIFRCSHGALMVLNNKLSQRPTSPSASDGPPAPTLRGLRVSLAAATNSVTNSSLPLPKRRRQVRRKPRNRHPPHYWSELSNVHKELSTFWSDLLGDDEYADVVASNAPPRIPNEALLNYFERHDLRYAIVLYGGRQALSHRLGDAPILSGTWKRAVQGSPELQTLIRQGKYALSASQSPLSPGQKKAQTFKESKRTATRRNETARWMHRPGRKPKGYWTLQGTIQELFDYLDECPTTHRRPKAWMPRSAELNACGRQDLQLAIRRFGGASKICRMARLVPYPEWHYFEGQLQLFMELRDYLDEFCNGDRTMFPSATSIQRNGYESLYALIQQYGGRKFLSNRLSLSYSTSIDEYAAMNWGPFSIDFAVELLQFVRDDQMQRRAPLKKPAIAMPSERKLLKNERIGLHEQIQEFGGYENVARRLGLAFFDL